MASSGSSELGSPQIFECTLGSAVHISSFSYCTSLDTHSGTSSPSPNNCLIILEMNRPAICSGERYYLYFPKLFTVSFQNILEKIVYKEGQCGSMRKNGELAFRYTTDNRFFKMVTTFA